MGEANEVSHFGYNHHGCDHLEALEAHHRIDDWLAAPIRIESNHVTFITGDALVELFDLADLFFENDTVGGKWQG